MNDIPSIAWFTVAMASLATLVMLPPGVAVAWLLARRRFPGRVALETLVSLPLVLPPLALPSQPPQLQDPTPPRTLVRDGPARLPSGYVHPCRFLGSTLGPIHFLQPDAELQAREAYLTLQVPNPRAPVPALVRPELELAQVSTAALPRRLPHPPQSCPIWRRPRPCRPRPRR